MMAMADFLAYACGFGKQDKTAWVDRQGPGTLMLRSARLASPEWIEGSSGSRKRIPTAAAIMQPAGIVRHRYVQGCKSFPRLPASQFSPTVRTLIQLAPSQRSYFAIPGAFKFARLPGLKGEESGPLAVPVVWVDHVAMGLL